jgi:hypothetical protein
MTEFVAAAAPSGKSQVIRDLLIWQTARDRLPLPMLMNEDVKTAIPNPRVRFVHGVAFTAHAPVHAEYLTTAGAITANKEARIVFQAFMDADIVQEMTTVQKAILYYHRPSLVQHSNSTLTRRPAGPEPWASTNAPSPRRRRHSTGLFADDSTPPSNPLPLYPF